MTVMDQMGRRSAASFCEEFQSNTSRPRYVLGTNEYADSLAKYVDVDGFIDDFTDRVSHGGKPILRIDDVPRQSLVVSAVTLGRPLTAMRKLLQAGLECMDYYQFSRVSGLPLLPVTCLEDFQADYRSNRHQYTWVRSILADQESRETFDKIVAFRTNYDLSFMEGFTDRQKNQYFEGFLELQPHGEVFADIGSFDGYTSEQFIKRYPDYRGVYVFEPEALNMQKVRRRLAGKRSVTYFQCGLSDHSGRLRFSSSGSASAICETGEHEIEVRAFDELGLESVTFMKMDIEGAERNALAGARGTIEKARPRLAVCVYHRGSDFWQIPKQVLSYWRDYRVYLRHYTEGVVETVMFFVP